MKQKDEGVIHKLFAMILLLWAVICWSVLLSVTKAGYTGRFLEDCLTQANLAALIVDPYHYGSTGELVFENISEVKAIFEDALEKGLGSDENRQRLGIAGEVQLLDLRIYEVTGQGTGEFRFDGTGNCNVVRHAAGSNVLAPDGTHIQSSSVYAKIAVPTEFLFGVEVTAIKEHCVDIVSEE